jgi:hypothetical protein
MADVPNVIGGDFDPLSPQPTPGAAALNGGGADDDAADRKARAEYYRTQTEELGRLGKKEEELYSKREQEEEPLRRDYAKSLQRQSQISDAATERLLAGQRDIPEPPTFNGPEAQKDAIAWMNLAAGFGAIAGGLSRYHTTTALNAFSGMMTGFAKGQIQAFDENYKTWSANADRALEYNNRAQREYKAIMDNAKLNIDAKSNLMQMTAEKWQDQIMANAARIRDVGRMTQLMEGQARFEEGLKLRKDAFEAHKKNWDLMLKSRTDQLYGSAEDVEGTTQQVLNLAAPLPNSQLQARYPWLRQVAREVMKRNPSYRASDYTADQAVHKLAATADVVAMRGALSKLEGMQSALATFEPLAKYNGQVIRALVDKVDATGTQTVFETWLRAGRKATGDPDVQQFDMAVNNYKTEAARIINNPALGGVLTDTARGEISALVPENITPSNAKRATAFLDNEMDYRRANIAAQIDYLKGQIQNISTGGPKPTYTSPEPPPIIPPAPVIIQGGGGGTDEYTIEQQ